MAEQNIYLHQPSPQPTAPPPPTTTTTTAQQHIQRQHPQHYSQQNPQSYSYQPPVTNTIPVQVPPTSPPTSPQTPKKDPTSITDDLEKEEYRRLHAEKAVATLSAGLLSILTISLSYVAVFASSDIYRTTIAPLASTSVLIAAAIISALYLFAVPGISSKLAIIPIIFAIVSGAMIILLNAASKASNDGGFVTLNRIGVLLSAGVFGGLGLGTTLGFLVFGSREDYRFPI